MYQTILAAVLFLFFISAEGQMPAVIDQNKLSKKYYQNDKDWFLKNIPFFECSDKQLEQVYYYRWKMYKAHIRNVGENQYVITEFINHVSWDREPYCTINAASMHHIYEGRWLKDDRYVNGYISNLYQHGGNNRQYSEGIADATYARYLVNGDSSFIMQQLDSMKRIYEGWYDHWDSSKNLYYIPAMPDATEYTIASVDASGGKDGFDDGEAFRPTFNSYMYGNALAIAHIAAMKKDYATSKIFLLRAASLKNNVEKDLWNPSLQHFTDRFKVTNQYVRYWDFIRGRELAGMIPWFYNLPSDTPAFNASWKHVLDTSQLLGPYGLRTNEPSYQYYFKQYQYTFGKPGSQWNGPSWPYETSQVITGMANLLNNYKQDVITKSDYLKLLRQFAQQHYLPDGKIDLVENYHPDKGGPLVYFYWSNHYNHSSFNNMVISGLCGVRPSAGDTLTINPLVDSSINYFSLQHVLYHGHDLTIVYDKNGNIYRRGKGLNVYLDGNKRKFINTDGGYKLFVGASLKIKPKTASADLALNILKKGFPVPSASVNTIPDSLYQAIDGRIWYFPEISNRWTTYGSTSASDWYAIDFGKAHKISGVNIYLVADNNMFSIPDSIVVEYKSNDQWQFVRSQKKPAQQFITNTVNTINFQPVITPAMRINFKHGNKTIAISEIECFNSTGTEEIKPAN